MAIMAPEAVAAVEGTGAATTAEGAGATEAVSARPTRAGRHRSPRGTAPGPRHAKPAKGVPRHATRSRQTSARIGEATKKPRQYAAKRGKAFTIKKMQAPGSGALFAEYFAGVILIILDLFTEGPSKGYLGVMPKVMVRLTALTAVFFVLFLMMGSKRGGQAAVWFGLLIDLGIVFTAARGQTLSTTASEIAGQGIPGIQLDASYQQMQQAPPGIQLSDE